MDLADIRKAIDGIDTTLLNSFVERMDIATEVAKSKIEMGKAVFDPARERSKLNNLASRAPERYEAQTIALFRLLMSMSKAEQQRYINELKGITVSQKAHATAAASDTPFPQTATVACQGVEGAYSQIAACKLFDVPDIAFFETFEGVMRAVRDGFCEFGVLPIENSTAGSVNAVYDLLAQFNFHIVRSLRLKIDHNLLVKPGTKLADAVAPVFAPAGFDDWHASAALITGFVAKEVVVGSMSQSYHADEPDDAASQQAGEGTLGQKLRASFDQSSHGHGKAAAIAFLLFTLAYTPCLATVAEMRRQFGTKVAARSVLLSLAVAYVIAIIAFQTLRLIW